MRNKDNIKEFLDYFQNLDDKPFHYDEEAIVSAYQKDNGNQSLSIKVLSVFGGILAALAFLVFVIVSELHRSNEVLFYFGGMFIAGSILINKKYDSIIIETTAVTFYIIGFIQIGYSCSQLGFSTNDISIFFIIVALGSLSIVQNYILSFISTLIINGSVLTLIISNNNYDFIHVYVSVLALILTYFFLKEATIITTNKALSKLYNPVRTGLIISFLSGVIFLGTKGIFPVSSDYIWLSSIIIISLIVNSLSKLFNVLGIAETRHKIGIYTFTVLLLLPTALSPAISGAILVVMLSFLTNYKSSLVLGIISFIYFISQYYYDLSFTLLTKSILLFSTGVLFITLYLFTYKKMTANEKV